MTAAHASAASGAERVQTAGAQHRPQHVSCASVCALLDGRQSAAALLHRSSALFDGEQLALWRYVCALKAAVTPTARLAVAVAFGALSPPCARVAAPLLLRLCERAETQVAALRALAVPLVAQFGVRGARGALAPLLRRAGLRGATKWAQQGERRQPVLLSEALCSCVVPDAAVRTDDMDPGGLPRLPRSTKIARSAAPAPGASAAFVLCLLLFSISSFDDAFVVFYFGDYAQQVNSLFEQFICTNSRERLCVFVCFFSETKSN